ncbi:hypothetical protein [Blastopirellula marina]|uniref:Colicin V production protein n=1 Tax=Blastopirellula marina TaxID=124 RepID=A0A2S8F4S7_9BACT|nr:hypothetical protein [Blastopirellula marina]PQO27163.1 hypothetical protein C5Y98_28370 [Blastopirellula marina]PTL41310.1 hypothetical protein C5Y97_28385 [Blastopirellula marina]
MDLHFWIFVVGLPLVLFAVAYSQCFWTNFLNCLLIILCSALSFNYAQLLANLINDQAPEWSAFTEFACMWLVFIITFLIGKLICNQLSKFPVRMGEKYDTAFDWVGCGLQTIVLYGWICFSLFASPVGDDGFIQMMRGGIPSSVAQAYGTIIMGLPSNLGMGIGGQPFDVGKYASTRTQRAADEVNHDKK